MGSDVRRCRECTVDAMLRLGVVNAIFGLKDKRIDTGPRCCWSDLAVDTVDLRAIVAGGGIGAGEHPAYTLVVDLTPSCTDRTRFMYSDPGSLCV